LAFSEGNNTTANTKQSNKRITMSSNKPPPSPSKTKSPRPKVLNSALEVSEKAIAKMGMFSPSGGDKGWSKVSPNFQRLSVRAGDTTKIAPANLDDDDDVAESKSSSTQQTSKPFGKKINND
jgi:hypothetical protein